VSSLAKAVLGLGLGLAVILVGSLLYFSPRWPPRFEDTPYPPITASTDPAVIAEGKYVATAVAYCVNCHLPKSEVIDTVPEVTAQLVPSGGGRWDLGPLGVLFSPNLTPDRAHGIGSWSDGEVARALRYGIDRQGRPLIYMIGVGPMGDPDLRALVSYLRSLSPVANRVPSTQITSKGRREILAHMPGLIEPKPQFSVTYVARGGISIARGAYLANGPAGCFRCHSEMVLSPSLAVVGPRFAGALEAEPDPDHPAMELNAPNLTPSPRFGRLTGMSEGQFLMRFRAGRAFKNSDMPWENFRLMTDEDLISIFRYLRSLVPVDRDAGPSYRPTGWRPPSASQAP
jgi:hypothetical protein